MKTNLISLKLLINLKALVASSQNESKSSLKPNIHCERSEEVARACSAFHSPEKSLKESESQVPAVV